MTKKIAVSLPDDLVDAARQAVAEGRAASVSAYVADALSRHAGSDEELVAMLEEMRAVHGEPSAEHYAWADRALGIR